MRRYLNGEIALGFALGVLTLLFLAAIASYQVEHCGRLYDAKESTIHPLPTTRTENGAVVKGDGETNYADSHHVTCGIVVMVPAIVGFMDENEGFFVGIFTFLLVVATILLWRSTNALWDAGERQLTHLQDSSERRLRAYVYIDNAFFEYNTGDVWKLKYVIKNYGQTPAHDVRLAAIAETIDWNNGAPVTPSPSTEWIPLGSMAPGGDFLENEIAPDTPAIRDEIIAGLKAISLVGKITYLDVFKKERRETNFCFYIGGDVGCDGNEMYADDEGNNAT